MRLLLIILLFLLPLFALSSNISCSNIGYAGKQLKFYTPSDPISGTKKLAFTLNFNEQGYCQTTLNNKVPLYAFCNFGLYKGMLLIAPNSNIKLKLPPFRKKSFANQKNPYFSPVEFWFISESKKQLTDKINKFEQQFNHLLDKQFKKLYFQQSKSVFDSMLILLNKSFPETEVSAFTNHKKMRLQFTKSDIFRLNPENYTATFNKIKTEYWLHESFLALFEKTFDSQLTFSAKAIGGKEISSAVARQDVNALLAFVKKKYKLKGKISELVLLKLLHDGFYSGDFSKTAIKRMIASNLFTQNTNAIIKVAAKNILSKFSFLRKGSIAPEICLETLSAQKSCTTSSKTKFKYLVFADAETIVSKEHLKYLSRINELFNKHLDIYIILRDTPRKGIDDFFTKNKISGIKMLDSEDRNSEHYKIRSFPQCFLLNENHKIAFNGAKNPLDGFEQQFSSFLRQELFLRQREQAK